MNVKVCILKTLQQKYSMDDLWVSVYYGTQTNDGSLHITVHFTLQVTAFCAFSVSTDCIYCKQ